MVVSYYARHTAHRANLKPYGRRRKPLLSEASVKRRRTFARLYRNTNWRQVLFTDEKTFYLFGAPNKKNDVVWESDAEAVPPSISVKHPQKLNVWGGFSYFGKTSLHIFTENMDADLYVSILEKRLTGVDDLFPGRTWMFQQDGDPKHRSNKAISWLDTNVPSYIPPDHWPPYSPDLNPIENLWAIMQDRVSARNPRSIQSLKRVIKEEWDNLDISLLRKLVDSMPRRISAVLKNRGKATKY